MAIKNGYGKLVRISFKDIKRPLYIYDITGLHDLLQEELEKENYEEAARIRDHNKKCQGTA